MGITYGDHLIDSGYYDPTPEQENEGRYCTMGVGCDEAGVCYAAANGQPDQCPRRPRRCETNFVGGMGECLHCDAQQGEHCRAALHPTQQPPHAGE